MPRYWFIAKDDATLIQVHRNAFLFNWRLRAEEYPRFESVFEAFHKHRSTFIEFLKEDLNTGKIEQAKYQLSYVNLFENVPYWLGPDDTSKIVPSFALPSASVPNVFALDNGNFRAVWKNSEGERVALEFQGSQTVGFVIFEYDHSLAKMMRMAGIQGLSRIKEVPSHCLMTVDSDLDEMIGDLLADCILEKFPAIP